MRNQSLATTAKSAIIPVILSVGLLASLSASAADPVYKWTDAQGHSHYAQSPPEGIKYQTMSASGETAVSQLPLSSTPTAQPEPKQDATPTNTDDSSNRRQTPAQAQRQKLCDGANANVATLNQHATVVSDINGDGKAVTLNAKQHDDALSDAKKQAALYCTN